MLQFPQLKEIAENNGARTLRPVVKNFPVDVPITDPKKWYIGELHLMPQASAIASGTGQTIPNIDFTYKDSNDLTITVNGAYTSPVWVHGHRFFFDPMNGQGGFVQFVGIEYEK